MKKSKYDKWKETLGNEPLTFTRSQRSNKLTQDQFNATLNFMLQHQIITTSEYNELLLKSLPYLNR